MTVEHVLPKKPTAEWIANFVNEEEADESIFRLGNLCLVAQNKPLGRLPFKDKQVLYAKSELELTRELSEHNGKWDLEAIEVRQEMLAKYAVQA